MLSASRISKGLKTCLRADKSHVCNVMQKRSFTMIPEGEVVVEETGEGPCTELVKTRRHEFKVDEIQSRKGFDKGPSPFDLILGALGSSTAMTIRKHADENRWKLEKAIITLTHKRAHVRDLPKQEKSQNPHGKVDLYHRKIELVGELTHEQRVELLKIADTCPVLETLASTNIVESDLAEAPGQKSGKHHHKTNDKNETKPSPKQSNW